MEYTKWVNDKISAMRVYKPFAHFFREIHYHFYVRDNEWHIIANSENAKHSGDTIDGVMALIKKQGIVSLKTSTGDKQRQLSYDNGMFNFDDAELAEEFAIESIFADIKSEEVFVISEHIDFESSKTKVIKLRASNTLGDNPTITSEADDAWEGVPMKLKEEIISVISSLCLYTPLIESYLITIAINDSEFKLLDFETDVLGKKKESLDLKFKKGFAKVFYPDGFDPVLDLNTRVLPRFIKDLTSNKETDLKDKLWSYKYGYLSFRLAQYELTEETRQHVISDFEYKWLRHLNNKYRIWLEDKLTIRYILSDFKECLPEYYYTVALKEGKNRIVKLVDCPDGLGTSYEDIFKLVEEKKILALKPDEGTHGIGFFKFTYENQKYYLNDKEASKGEVILLLNDVRNQYVITEFIVMHPEIAAIYQGSVNTVRLTVFKKDGKKPQIGNGYMRFGTSKTGGVDNVSAGGVSADLDVESGYFYNPVMMQNRSKLIPTLHHPDTGAKMEGYLPNWEKVKDQILKIAEAIPELEYFGFDIAITPDGIKFPEINRYPDFPKINKLTPVTMDYLLHKLHHKKKKHGYMDAIGKRSIIKLPKR